MRPIPLAVFRFGHDYNLLFSFWLVRLFAIFPGRKMLTFTREFGSVPSQLMKISFWNPLKAGPLYEVSPKITGGVLRNPLIFPFFGMI